ncbi:MAG TPA: hypothetical protein VK120_10640 [Sporosarcina sp.]|nr:hypothetical protein [Sporosarcina sp.]
MIKKGRFAVVDGQEYELISRMEQYYIVSRNIFDLSDGFKQYDRNRNYFLKEICLAEIEDAYEIFPYVIVESYRFSVETMNECTGEVLLVTSNPFVQKRLNVKPYRAGEFMIEMSIGELIIEEDKMAILGFEHRNTYKLFQS